MPSRRNWRQERRPDVWTTFSASSPPATPAERRHECAERRLRAGIQILFRHAARVRLYRDLPVRDGRVHVLPGPFLRQWLGRPLRLLRLSPLALSVPGPGAGDAALGGRT